MTERARDLAERLRLFNNEIITFVENCSDDDWKRICTWEEWTVGVTARHIGAGHYDIIGLAKMIVDGEELPELTMDQINEMANQHAREHADCTKDEVLDILGKNGAAIADFVAGLNDAELDRSSHLAALGGYVSTQQLIELVIFQSAAEHFANIKKAADA
jgi:uncharacterized damage-inducible protein DinB